MSICAELLVAARQNPKGVRFTDLCALATCFGWEFDRTKGSHHVYKKRGHRSLMNFQEDSGKAKAYQVRQLIAAIDEMAGEADEK